MKLYLAGLTLGIAAIIKCAEPIESHVPPVEYHYSTRGINIEPDPAARQAVIFEDDTTTTRRLVAIGSTTDSIEFSWNIYSEPPELTRRSRGSPLQSIMFVEKNQYYINDIPFTVIKSAIETNVMDGCISYFWTEKWGVILRIDRKYGYYTALKCSEPSTGNLIETLIEQILIDYKFSLGCDHSVLVIPESLWRKYIVPNVLSKDISRVFDPISN